MLDDQRKTVEHDIDIILLEDIHVSQSFRNWLVNQTYGGNVAVQIDLVSAWRSVSETTLGESDILFIFRRGDSRRHALLIENKVSAPAQPEQGLRYRARGKRGIEKKDWDSFTTVILAPEVYLEGSRDASK